MWFVFAILHAALFGFICSVIAKNKGYENEVTPKSWTFIPVRNHWDFSMLSSCILDIPQDFDIQEML